MSDKNRDQVAYELFEIMNRQPMEDLRNTPGFTLGMTKRLVSIEDALRSNWDFMVEHGWHKGYLRIADAIIKKGYKP